MAAAAATQYGIPPDIFASLIQQESGWRPDVISSAGAIGPAQLMPGTAEGLGVDPYDPAQNIEGGARYLAQQYERFGSWPLALAAYNAGPGAVTRYGGIPPFAETQAYVPAVLGRVGGTDPMAMTPDPEQQPQGFFGRVGQGLGELFPALRAAPDSSPTDPFEGLSRNQRMMLGFASIRDAAEALQGRQSSHFRDALGGFETARERERLRRQGELANRAAALQGLAQIQQQIAIARESGVAPSPAQMQLEQYFTEMLTSAGGGLGGGALVSPQGAAPTAAPLPEIVPTGGVADPIPAGGALPTDVPPMRTEEPVATPDVPPREEVAGGGGINDLIAQRDELVRRLNTLGGLEATAAQTAGVRTQLDLINEEIELARQAGVAAAETALANEDSAVSARSALNLIEEIEGSTALSGVLGPRAGRLSTRTAAEGAGALEQLAGAAFLNEDEAAVLARVDQLLGEAFLQAFNSLRGGGQITQIEGAQATRAIQRLGNRLVSEDEYREALEDLRQIYENALARAEGQPLPHEAIGVEGPQGLTPSGGGAPSLSDDAMQFLNP